MLQNTFIHIQGIGAITEQKLWESGLSHWDAFSDDISIPLSVGRKYLLQKGIEESRQHLYQNNPGYFSINCHQINPGDFSLISGIQLRTWISKPPDWIAITIQ